MTNTRAALRVSGKELNLDFALIFVVATAVTGVIWAIDALFLKRRRSRRGSREGGA